MLQNVHQTVSHDIRRHVRDENDDHVLCSETRQVKNDYDGVAFLDVHCIETPNFKHGERLLNAW